MESKSANYHLFCKNWSIKMSRLWCNSHITPGFCHLTRSARFLAPVLHRFFSLNNFAIFNLVKSSCGWRIKKKIIYCKQKLTGVTTYKRRFYAKDWTPIYLPIGRLNRHYKNTQSLNGLKTAKNGLWKS